MKTNYYVLRLLALSSILFSAGCNNQNEPTDEDVNVEEITLNEKSLSLFKGDTVTLSATVKPLNATNREVTWESKDTSIATVDKGYVTAIKEGSTSIEVRSVSNKEVFAVCTVDVLSKGTEDDASVTFKSKTMPTFRYSTSQTGDTNVFFREDKLTQLPYISLKTFYSLLIGKNLTITKLETDKYKVTSPNGEEALINTKDNTLECADLENFISSSIFRQDNITNVYFDGAPFVRVNKVEKDRTPRKTIIDFEKYGINLFGREDDIILPLVTASNLFEGPTMITCFYNKDEIIFIDPNDPLCDTRTFTTREYYEKVNMFFNNGKRTIDEAKFSYGELCFYLDTFYGLPGREYIHEAYAKNKDIDKVLKELNDITRKARQLLLSTNEAEYLAGHLMLNDFFSDAGHSVTGYGANSLSNLNDSLHRSVLQVLDDIPYREGETAAKRNSDYDYIMALSEATRNRGNNNLGTVVSGNTLIFRFDSFDFNIHEWREYYKNPGLERLPSDTVGSFRKVLDKYKENPNIKNVVVDITTNGGGYGDVVSAYMGLMAGKSYLHFRDMIGDYICSVTYDFDANFDGKFDEQDKDVKYPFNFAILTSAYSFSCGNILPTQAKDNGIMVIGDNSGGGCCAVLDAITAEGLYVRLSSPIHFLSQDNKEVEFGVEVDKSLVTKIDDSRYDFSKLYDYQYIDQEVTNFYANK